jgi:hypothetical protein
MDHRLDTGHWDSVAKTSSLQASAESLGLDGAAFIDLRPGEFVNDRDRTVGR